MDLVLFADSVLILTGLQGRMQMATNCYIESKANVQNNR